jgi:carbon storage regulator
MLVLSRKHQDTIVIDQRIRIQVLGIRGDRIRLGIEAPDDVIILRGELLPTATGGATEWEIEPESNDRIEMAPARSRR